MRTIGFLFPPSETRASLVAGGLTAIERQARQLSRAGADALFAVDVVPLTQLPAGVTAITAAGVLEVVEARDRVVAIAAGLIIDERAIAAVLAAPVPAMLVRDATQTGAEGIERLDALTFAGGVMTISGTIVRRIASGLGEWDMESTLIRAAAEDPATARIELSSLPVYAPNRRRDVPMLWMLPQSPNESRDAGDAVIAAAQKGCLDWPARFIHPPIEDALVRALAPTKVTPNQVTLATGVIGIIAGVAFACGQLWLGPGLALLTGPLDGVDGKLARTRVEF